MHPIFAIGLPHGTDWIYILVLPLVGFVLWIGVLIDCVTKEASTGNTKIVWVIIICLTGFIGGLAYLIIRRPQRIRELGC
jgi:hypothetical protein